MITLGGDAELELVDSLDPFSEGIVFSVRPPKKSWKNISNLSGGEKTLSSLALVGGIYYMSSSVFPEGGHHGSPPCFPGQIFPLTNYSVSPKRGGTGCFPPPHLPSLVSFAVVIGMH